MSGFALVASVVGFCANQFGRSRRQALEDALLRERELQGIRTSLEARTAELSSAKEALERELIVRRQAEAELAHERDLLHALMDNIPDTIYFKDTASRFTRINRAQAQMLGVHDPSEAIGKTDFDFQTADLAQSFYDEEYQIVESGEPVLDRIEFNPTADGQSRWLSSTKVPIRNQAGVVTGIVGVSRDITTRYEVDRLKNEFISTVSHELRTPLTSIRGSLGLLNNGIAGDVAPNVKAMINIAYKNSERLTRLVNDILDMEKIEVGKLVFQLAAIELGPLVEYAIEVNRSYAEQHAVTFVLAQPVPQAFVYSDSDRLMQVFTNLLSNAAKFAPAQTTVEVAISRHEQTLRVSISDHGPGVPEPFRAHIFEKFAQADGSDTRQKGGTGLGLSISKALVEQLGGQIGFISDSGQGATFYVDLPEWKEE